VTEAHLNQTDALSFGGMRSEDLLGNIAITLPAVWEYVLPALPFSLIVVVLLIYLRGMVRAYRAAGNDWQRMDHDVRMVFLFAVPLFRGGSKILVLADKLFYTPKAEVMKPGAR
jgi:hypothetical protein